MTHDHESRIKRLEESVFPQINPGSARGKLTSERDYWQGRAEELAGRLSGFL